MNLLVRGNCRTETLVAAVNTGRRYIGIELDPAYHATAAQRVLAAQQALAEIQATA